MGEAVLRRLLWWLLRRWGASWYVCVLGGRSNRVKSSFERSKVADMAKKMNYCILIYVGRLSSAAFDKLCNDDDVPVEGYKSPLRARSTCPGWTKAPLYHGAGPVLVMTASDFASWLKVTTFTELSTGLLFLEHQVVLGHWDDFWISETYFKFRYVICQDWSLGYTFPSYWGDCWLIVNLWIIQNAVFVYDTDDIKVNSSTSRSLNQSKSSKPQYLGF